MPKEFLYSELTYRIRGCCFEVIKDIGSGQKENIYQKALAIEFSKQNLHFLDEPKITITYKGKRVGVYRPDFVVEGKVLLELKSMPFLAQASYQQLQHYLKATQYEVGLLINFGIPQIQFHREVWFNNVHNAHNEH